MIIGNLSIISSIIATGQGMDNIYKKSDMLTSWFSPSLWCNKIAKWLFLISIYGPTPVSLKAT